MIPVLIVLGSAAASAAGLFVGAAATAAAHEVVQESKDELNAINADMQKMTEDANSAIASCKETYSVSMEKFDDARTNAYLSVLPEFIFAFWRSCCSTQTPLCVIARTASSLRILRRTLCVLKRLFSTSCRLENWQRHL